MLFITTTLVLYVSFMENWNKNLNVSMKKKHHKMGWHLFNSDRTVIDKRIKLEYRPVGNYLHQFGKKQASNI